MRQVDRCGRDDVAADSAVSIRGEICRSRRAPPICGFCTLRPTKSPTRRLNVPAQAREFLSGIVRNQIERLSPWPADEVSYGFTADKGDDGATLDVRVLMASRATIDNALSMAATAGLQVDRIVTQPTAGTEAEPSRCGRALATPRTRILRPPPG